MSKFATSALTHSVRFSGWDHGIRATAICPGFVATDMTADIRDPMPENMNHPGAIAQLVATVLTLPNPTSVVEIPINCRLEPTVGGRVGATATWPDDRAGRPCPPLTLL